MGIWDRNIIELLNVAASILSYRTGGFRWSTYTDIEARYNFTDLSTMFSSTAAEFDGSNYLEIGQAAVIAYPLTMLCWFKSTTNASQMLMFVGDKDTANANQILYISGTQVACQSTETTGVSAATSAIDPDDGS